MREPTWTSFLLRVGGLSAAFSVAILVTRRYFSGYEGWAATAVSLAVVVGMAAKEWWAKRRAPRKRRRRQ